MTTRTRLAPFAFALALLAAACARESPSAAEPRHAEPAQARPIAGDPPVDLGQKEIDATIPVGGPKLVTSVRIGSADPGDETPITAGTPITATLETRPLPAGSVVRMLLRRGDRVVETQKGVDEHARSVVITNDQTGALEPGEWALEIWLGGAKVDERTIQIVGSEG